MEPIIPPIMLHSDIFVIALIKRCGEIVLCYKRKSKLTSHSTSITQARNMLIATNILWKQ